MTEAFLYITVVFLPSYKSPKTLPVTTLLLFGPVTLLCVLKCGTFLFYRMSIWLSDCEHHQTDTPLFRTVGCFHSHRARLASAVAVILSHRQYQHMIPTLEGQCEWGFFQQGYRKIKSSFLFIIIKSKHHVNI